MLCEPKLKPLRGVDMGVVLPASASALASASESFAVDTEGGLAPNENVGLAAAEAASPSVLSSDLSDFFAAPKLNDAAGLAAADVEVLSPPLPSPVEMVIPVELPEVVGADALISLRGSGAGSGVFLNGGKLGLAVLVLSFSPPVAARLAAGAKLNGLLVVLDDGADAKVVVALVLVLLLVLGLVASVDLGFAPNVGNFMARPVAGTAAVAVAAAPNANFGAAPAAVDVDPGAAVLVIALVDTAFGSANLKVVRGADTCFETEAASNSLGVGKLTDFIEPVFAAVAAVVSEDEVGVDVAVEADAMLPKLKVLVVAVVAAAADFAPVEPPAPKLNAGAALAVDDAAVLEAALVPAEDVGAAAGAAAFAPNRLVAALVAGAAFAAARMENPLDATGFAAVEDAAEPAAALVVAATLAPTTVLDTACAAMGGDRAPRRCSPVTTDCTLRPSISSSPIN